MIVFPPGKLVGAGAEAAAVAAEGAEVAAEGTGRVFWSGPGTPAAAEQFAKSIGGKTLGQTLEGVRSVSPSESPSELNFDR